ncbi:MAG: HAMP domain-containing protein [Lachnospiraceae bacterium]|nr:HAMP domain-containing protein [Lachnospiraceae bacterium]
MGRSLKSKISLLFTFLLFLMIFLCWMANNFFLPAYYEKTKVNSLEDVYDKIDEIVSLYGHESDDAVAATEKVESVSNVSIYILSDLNGDGLDFIYPLSFNIGSSEGNVFRNDRLRRIIDALQRYLFGPGPGETTPELLKTKEKYYDVFMCYESRYDSKYIDLVGYLKNRDLIFIRTSYSNISESAVISNQFLLISGGILLVLCSILTYLFSCGITKPILNLSDISKEMSQLKFENRYTGKRKDEIGELGRSINTLSDKLEKTISELKSANIELEKDIKKKTEAEEMRREFLSNVSHELKTPIALIQGYAEGLAENINDDEESRQFYCDVIVDEAQKMNNMVKKLLTLNELEFGNSNVELSRFDIVALVKSVADSVEVLAKQKNINIVFNGIEPIYVWADEYMIEEVITNYLSNALNHCKDPNVIDISFNRHDKKIRVSVFNSGDIINEADIGNIWDKFYKVDKARTREYGGSGIGLSIVKAIMESHNEEYGVINHQAGVEFWFELTID